jgi:hypothetical protein
MKLKDIVLKAVLFFLFTFHLAKAQENINESDVAMKVYKNALTVRPFNLIYGGSGLSYERYITKKISAVIYGEYISGPFLLESSLSNWNKSSMDVTSAKLSYEGWGVIPEIRKYFYKKDPEASLIGAKEQFSLNGWFVGIYFPIRKLSFSYNVVDNQYFANAIQQDTGKYEIKKMTFGFGIEAGRHWVWDRFSLEIVGGLAYSSGIGGTEDFTYNRPGISTYIIPKDLGILSILGRIQPRLNVNLGIAF